MLFLINLGQSMSKIDLTISNEMVIPHIESMWFQGHEDSTFAIGMIAVGDQILPGRESEFDGYLKLRANVYAYQTQMIPTDLVRHDGTEIDEDDARSTHWALLEHQGQDSARVVGSIRTIEKRGANATPLPIEDFFPEVYKDNPLPAGSVEVSRYIARHEDLRTQALLSEPLFAKVVSHVTAYGLGPTFGVVEPKVERHLGGRLQVPLSRVADPKYVPEYAADNLGIFVDIPKMASHMGLDTNSSINRIRATEQNIDYFNLSRRIITAA